MISVGSRDGGKRIGSGLEMEEVELEEGEALNYGDEGGDTTIDPDIALSYIEEKLQNVLGHFQKDFEGGVSAENLGAKFGGYGSFLPTYQRSPSWSHTKSPAEFHNYDSPRKLHSEDQRQNSFASSSASPSARSRAAPGKAVSVAHSLKGNGNVQSRQVEESSLIKSGNTKKSVYPSSDQKTLKVRIKVGSENLSTQKNAEIYSGLGLEVSPSSSLDDSPATSEGQIGKLLDMPDESPTSILEIMTSYPGELLLSPLPEDLIHLTEKKKFRVKSDTTPGDKRSLENSGMLVNGSLSSKTTQKAVKDYKKSSKSSDKKDASSRNKINGKMENNNVSLLKMEKQNFDIDTSGCDELVSNALKLPLLSSSQHTFADPLKYGVKGEIFSAFTDNEHLDVEYAQSSGKAEKLDGRVGSSSGKVSESRKVNLNSNIASGTQSDVPKSEKSHALDQLESNISKGGKALNALDPAKEMVEKSVSEESLKPAAEKSSTGGKRKQKAAQSIGTQGALLSKDELMVESSLSPNGKSSHANTCVSKKDSFDPQKDHEKPGNTYKVFFGDEEFEEDDNQSISGEMASSSGWLKNPQHVGKRSLSEERNMSKEKFVGKSSKKPLPPETHPRPASHLAPGTETSHRPASHLDPGNGPGSEAPTGTIPLVDEFWVECDKCKKWRLLPLGKTPNSLPDKWVCRMLTWLPGMNRCSIPENETTNALRATYQPTAASVPALASESSQHIRLSDSIATTSAGMTLVDARHHPGQDQQNVVAVQTGPISMKKKHGLTKAANSTDLDGSTHSSSSRNKNVLASGKITGNDSPSLDGRGFQHMPQSSVAVEKYNDTKKEKMSLANSSDKGTNLKVKNKREADVEGSRASKRIKSEELPYDDENWTSDNGGTSSKAGRGSTSLSNSTPYKNNNHKDLSGEAKKNTFSSMNAAKHIPHTSDDGLYSSGKCDDNKDSVRKRKPKEHHGTPIHSEGMCESDHRKEKKARISNSGGKDRKSRSTKDRRNEQFPSNTQTPDYMKSDMASIQPSVAANSSSSKVSDSHKNRTNGPELKGSPVESVSSSPLRLANVEKATSARKSLVGKVDIHDSGSLTAVSPRRLSVGEDVGNDRIGSMKKDAVITDVDARVKQTPEPCKVVSKTNTDQTQNHSKSSGKGSSSQSKDKARTSGAHLDKVNIKASDSSRDASDYIHLHEGKSKSRRNKSDEKSSTPSKGEKFVSKKDTAGGTSIEGGKEQSSKKYGQDRQEAVKVQDKKQQSLQQEHDNEKSASKKEVYGSGKLHSLPPLARGQTETVAGQTQKQNGVKGVAADGSDNGDAIKVPNQRKICENLNGQPIRHPTPNKGRDAEAPSPVRRESSSHAANNALKEAKDLKHLADRLKNNGSSESNGYYFEAALKFLYGACLLESGSNEASKHNDLMHSMAIYSSTAKLCEFCAHEFEKSKNMAAAALAHKCVEVAYMRVVYASHNSASRDRIELQNALQIVPTGESPSSSASDIDNLNHQATTDKSTLAKIAGSPQISGSNIITSRNRSFLRVLNFAQDVNSAMEASRKSRIAFAAATSRLEETSHNEGISSLKKALDFNFQDVDGFLLLVRVAMEAMNP